MKNLKINFSKMFSLKGIALALVVTSAFSLTGCGKKAECDISGNHAHKYENEIGYVRYIDSEYLSYQGYERSDDYIEYDDQKLMDYEVDKKLLKIEDNLEVIEENQKNLKDFIEYRYSYTTLMPIPHIMHTGKSTITYFTYIPITHHSWTTNPEHSRLTGEERLCHYECTAYKLEKDEKGRYVLIPSKPVDDIREVMDEYSYMKETYYKAVDVKYGKDLDYEDGQAEDNPNYDKEKDIPLEEQETKEEGKKLTK